MRERWIAELAGWNAGAAGRKVAAKVVRADARADGLLHRLAQEAVAGQDSAKTAEVRGPENEGTADTAADLGAQGSDGHRAGL